MSSEPPASLRFRYVPALDGLRSVAIVLVMLFHYPWANPYFEHNPVHGGFLGVDVFFVLSGFLITSLLLQEHGDTAAVSLRGFYVRRALRLFPAFAVLLVFAIVAHFALVEDAQRPSWFGIFGMVAYLANWVQLWQHDPLGPLFGHTWSLAIEEQFYLFFPLLMVVMLRLRLRRVWIGTTCLAIALASALWRSHLWHLSDAPPSFIDWYARITGRSLPATNPFSIWNRWYFGTDARLDGLLIGCAAAVLFATVGPRLTLLTRRVLAVVGVAAMVGVAVIVSQASILSPWLPTWGLLLFNGLVAVSVLGIVANPMSWCARLFSVGPLVWIGRRSYAIYLFHQLVYYELGRSRTHLNPFWSFWFQMIAIGVLAELSWRLVEQRFLARKGRFARPEAPSQPIVAAE